MRTRQQVYIHPSSCLFHVKPHPELVVYSELVHTTKCYMRCVNSVKSNILVIITMHDVAIFKIALMCLKLGTKCTF